MHFALPPRKTSARPPAYPIKRRDGGGYGAFRAAADALQALRRSRPAAALTALLGVAALLLLLLRARGGGGAAGASAVPGGGGHARGGANVVLVTAFDAVADAPVWEAVLRNREEYARRHGYRTFMVSSANYSSQHGPTWAKVPAIRHAMTRFPQSAFFFYLDPHVLIRNYDIAVEKHVLDRTRLESLMITDVPVVPPDSVIKTFKNLHADMVDLIMTQDVDGLSVQSFILRRGDWAKYFLDAWYDPLYRTYNFQRADRHALEHIVQWHGTILGRLALVPQKIMNSYHQKLSSKAAKDGSYSDGDYILNFGDCNLLGRSCEKEMQPYLTSGTSH